MNVVGKKGFLRLCILAVLPVLVSCVRTGIVSGVPVTYARPDRVVQASADTSFRRAFPEVLYIRDIQVQDTVLFLRDMTGENNPYHFKAYSTKSFDYLGEFFREGRGPGEMIHPRISGCRTDDPFIGISDYAVAYMVDAGKMAGGRPPVITDCISLASEVIDWLPLGGQMYFVHAKIDGRLIFRVMDGNGNTVKTFNLYDGIDGDRCLTRLSSIISGNGDGKVAEAMTFFPQINIMDTETGRVRQIAVDRAYRKWKSVLDSRISLDDIGYYSDITSTSDFIIATYRNRPLGETDGKHGGTSVHVFDWDGDFLYDIRMAEDIGNITYDGRTGYLYCIDMDGNIIRYDLSELMPATTV